METYHFCPQCWICPLKLLNGDDVFNFLRTLLKNLNIDLSIYIIAIVMETSPYWIQSKIERGLCMALGCKGSQSRRSRFCKKHRCRNRNCGAYREPCPDTYTSRTYFCDECKCGYPECIRIHKFNQQYCKAHLCQYQGCHYVKSSCRKYCEVHKCTVGECTQGIDQCSQHNTKSVEGEESKP